MNLKKISKNEDSRSFDWNCLVCSKYSHTKANFFLWLFVHICEIFFSLQAFQSFANHIPKTATDELVHLEQLDDFSLLSIFDYLSFEDWLRIAGIHPRFADVILQHYIIGQHHLNENPITISLVFNRPYFGYSSASKTHYTLFNAENSTNTILSTLKLFGHAFRHITFEVLRFGNPISRTFFDHFDKYCKTTTKTIVIQSVDYAALVNWPYSFGETTTEVKVRPSLENPIPFNILFPYMQMLTVAKLLEANVQYYPYLKGCSTQTHNGDDKNPLVYELIRLNPQLSNLDTSIRTNTSYVQYLNEMLPNLETLSFRIGIHSHYIDPDQRIIRFKGVKELTIDIHSVIPLHFYRHVIENIQFDQLKAIKLDIFPAVFADAQLIEIIAMNRGLRTIKTNVRMTHEIFNGLLQALPELEEISIHWHHGMRETLRSFFIENVSLKRFNIDHNGFPMGIKDIEESIPSNWQIVPNEIPYSYNFSFIRRNLWNSSS